MLSFLGLVSPLDTYELAVAVLEASNNGNVLPLLAATEL